MSTRYDFDVESRDLPDHAAELRQWFGPHPATEAAIAEIARLRAENGRLQKSVDVKREIHDCMLKSMLAKIDEVKKLTTENERLCTVNAEMLALFDKLGATIERVRSREYRTYLLIRRLGFDCSSAKFITKKDAAPEEKP
jgi:hypothetical protein